MSCVVRDACTFRDDAQTGVDVLRVDQTHQHQQLSGRKGDLRQFRFEAESRGGSPQSARVVGGGLEPTQMRELHTAVRELVARDLQNELEPLRMQLAVQQRQLQHMEHRCQQIAQQHQTLQTRTELEGRTEKKLEFEPGPGFETWKTLQERRLSSAEHIIREMTSIQDKHSQRQDTLMQSFSELDEKIDKMTSRNLMVSPHILPDRIVAPVSMSDADFGVGRALESIMPNTASSVFTKSGIEVEEFTFEIDRSSGSLGLMLKNDGDLLAVEKINSGCILPVNIGDHVVAVNGVRNDVNAMLEELRRKARLSVTCERSLSTTV